MLSLKGLSALALILAVSTVNAAAAAVTSAAEGTTFLKAYLDAAHNVGGAVQANAELIVATAENFRYRNPALLWSKDHPLHIARLITVFNGHAADLAPLMTNADIDSIQAMPGQCHYFNRATFQNLQNKEATSKLNWSCMDEIAVGGGKVYTHLPLAKFKEINDQAFKDGMFEIVTYLEGNGGLSALHYLSEKQVDLVMSSKRDDVYHLFDVARLHTITDKRHVKLAKLKPHAFAHFLQIEAVAIPEDILAKLSADIFSEYEGVIHPLTLLHMTKAQVASFHANNKSERRCKNLTFDHLADKTLSELKPECFAMHLINRDGVDGSINFREPKSMSKLADNIFSAIPANDFELLARINPQHLIHLKKAHLQYLVEKMPNALHYIPEAAAENNSFVANVSAVITPKAFAFLMAPIQVAVITKGNKDALPVDILAYVTADMVEKYTHDKGSQMEFFEKFDIAPAQMVHLGSKASSLAAHPCALIENKSTLILDDKNKKTNLLKKMGPSCFAALIMKSELTEEELRQFPESVYALASMTEIKKNAPGLFKTIDAVGFGLMVNGDNFCGHVDGCCLSSVQPASFSAMTTKCLAVMKPEVRAAITGAQMAQMSVVACKDLDATLVSSMKPGVPAFTPAQIKVLSANVKERAKNAFATLTKESMAKFAPEQAASFTAEQLAATPAAAFKGLTKEQIAAVPAAALTHITFEQAKEVSEEVLLALSPAQITSLGSAVTDSAKTARKIFTKTLIGKMSKEQAEAAKAVAVESNAASVKASVAGAFAAIVAALTLF